MFDNWGFTVYINTEINAKIETAIYIDREEKKMLEMFLNDWSI